MLTKTLPNETALNTWEAEGGRIAATANRAKSRAEDATCLPELPPGYVAVPAWGFHDHTGTITYEFNRVYGPPYQSKRRGSLCQLDEALSYWAVTWPQLGVELGHEIEDAHPASRWMTYAQINKRPGHHINFAHFSSLPHMRQKLATLLRVEADDVLNPAP